MQYGRAESRRPPAGLIADRVASDSRWKVTGLSFNSTTLKGTVKQDDRRVLFLWIKRLSGVARLGTYVAILWSVEVFAKENVLKIRSAAIELSHLNSLGHLSNNFCWVNAGKCPRKCLREVFQVDIVIVRRLKSISEGFQVRKGRLAAS